MIFKPYSLFVCGITECVLASWDLLSWLYRWVYVSRHYTQVVPLLYCRNLAQMCQVEGMNASMFPAIQGQFVSLSVISESNAGVYECVYVQRQYRGSSSIYLWSQIVMLVGMSVSMFKGNTGQFVYLSVISESNACVCECVFQGIREAVSLSLSDLRE